MNIHPTAIIGSEVQLGDDVVIGPYAVLEGLVKVGPGCQIGAHSVLSGDTTLGERNVIGPHAVIGAFPQDLAFDPETPSRVEIGSDNRIREFCTIHRGTAADSVTHVGDCNYLMTGAHLGHNCLVGSHCILANNVLLGGHVHVDDRVFLGGGCVFHQFVRVGTLAITQGLSAFSKDVPPYALGARRNEVMGLNSVGLRRAGMTLEQRQEIKRAFALVFRSGWNVGQALEMARVETWSPPAEIFFAFVSAAKKKGICAWGSSRRESAEE